MEGVVRSGSRGEEVWVGDGDELGAHDGGRAVVTLLRKELGRGEGVRQGRRGRGGTYLLVVETAVDSIVVPIEADVVE
jgi:hypothetical protein